MHWIKGKVSEIAYGQEHGYLVIREESGVRLGWFSVAAAARNLHAVVAREVLASALVFPLGRGPGRPGGEPELDALVASAKVYAERFEAGESMVGPDWRGRAWQHEDQAKPDPSVPQWTDPDPPGRRRTTLSGQDRLRRYLSAGDASDRPDC